MNTKEWVKSSVGNILRTLCDLMLLNILWIVCVLPVFTFGPATSALCFAELKLAEDKPLAVLRDFFSAFRRNFGQGVILGLLGLLGPLVAVTDFRFAMAQQGGMRIFFLAVSLIVGAVTLGYLAFIFAVHARYNNSLSGHIRNALSIAFVVPGRTLLIALVFAVPVLFALYVTWDYVVRAVPIYILFGMSAPAYFAARWQSKLFARFSGEGKETDESPQ